MAPVPDDVLPAARITHQLALLDRLLERGEDDSAMELPVAELSSLAGPEFERWLEAMHLGKFAPGMIENYVRWFLGYVYLWGKPNQHGFSRGSTTIIREFLALPPSPIPEGVNPECIIDDYLMVSMFFAFLGDQGWPLDRRRIFNTIEQARKKLEAKKEPAFAASVAQKEKKARRPQYLS